MHSKNLCKSVSINAKQEQVWQALFDDKNYRIWASIFQAGSSAKTDWSLGSRVVFYDKSGFGLLGEVIEKKTYESLSIRYTGLMTEVGETDVTLDPDVITGSTETYTLSAHGEGTLLNICTDVSPNYFEDLCTNWDYALLQIKTLAEQELLFSCHLHAPREKAFKAWTAKHQLIQWFCPSDSSVEQCEVDAQPGGVFGICLKSLTHGLETIRGEYIDIVFPERLVFYMTCDDNTYTVPQMTIALEFVNDKDQCLLNIYGVFESQVQRNTVLSSPFIKDWQKLMTQLDHYLMNH